MERLLTSIIAVSIVAVIVYYGSPTLFLFFVAAVILMGVHEYFTIINRIGIGGFRIPGMALSLLLLLSFHFNGNFMTEWGLIAGVVLFCSVVSSGR